MADSFDFSELRNYLQGQIDLGGADILLDEPWTLVKRPATSAKPASSIPAPSKQTPAYAPSAPAMSVSPATATSTMAASSMSAMFTSASQPSAPSQASAPDAVPNFFGSSYVAGGIDMPAPRPARKVAASAFESAASLEAFYEAIAAEAVYSGVQNLVRYAGPANPKLLLLFAAPSDALPAENFFASPVGEMISRLFASLNISADQMGVAFFYKGGAPRNLPPLLETALRKMLTKELSFIAPEVMVTFGEPLFHQLFGKGKNFNDLAGADQDFSGTKTCSLVDAVAMSGDKQLKWLTWKVHIPKSSYFAVPK